ncbi:MAG TPA: phenylalanine--tRNA ligase subunit beta [Clostridiaceae bacterium]|nr:phenylalanine--tRNA ligase subunit beta [Clostridiaceae bacterium]
MKVPLNWLRDYVDINVTTKEFSDAMTLSGSKVEGIEVQGDEITNVVTGKVLSVEKHPNADKLVVCQVDVAGEKLQIVTGAPNVNEGDIVPVALHGSTLPGGIKIKKGKIRGVESQGMMCSVKELGITKEDYPGSIEDGILILSPDTPVGKDIKEVLGLNDTVFEFEITSNRPDCLSVLGIAREASAALRTELKKPEITLREEGDDVNSYATVKIEDPDLCPRYAARVVKDVKIEPSPEWLRRRLKAAGVRPINNIVDITNYVMLELGQPMHAFDLDRLQGKKIIVRRAKNGELLKTLDDQDRVLDSSMLVIADEEKPVGIAGVMGGANSEITENTKMILFESATFDGITVRLGAKKLGLRTEASSRFEKGLDIQNVITAIDRAAQLVEELGAGVVCKGIIDCYPKKYVDRYIKLHPEKINALLGTNIETKKMIDILKALEFEVDSETMDVKIPSFRGDIEEQADLAEEIARFYDYNNIEATLLSGKNATLGGKTRKQKIEDIIKNTMISCGLHETYSYSFTSPKVFDRIRIPENDRLRNAVVILNPLGEDYSIMRTTTIPDMLEIISRNFNRKVPEGKFFDTSYVYIPEGIESGKLPRENMVLTIGLYGNLDFFDLKGIAQELFDVLGINNVEYLPEKDNPTFHPGRTARILLNGENIGVIGEIHPDVAQEYEAPDRTYIGVIEVEPLIKYADLGRDYRPLPKYPAVTRDIALLIKDEVLVIEIENIIRKYSGAILEEITLFDVYKGKQVPEGMKSVAYSISFRSEDRTLTDEEVNAVMKDILKQLEIKLGAKLRE